MATEPRRATTTMVSFFEQLVARFWNSFHGRAPAPPDGGVTLGFSVVDGHPTKSPIVVPHMKRAHHIIIVGITGTGKSTLQLRMVHGDLQADRGVVCIQNDRAWMISLLRFVARQEQLLNRDLSDRLIIIDLTDPEYSVGLNVLEPTSPSLVFTLIAQFAQILKHRWSLDSFGARTDELLRYSLHVLAHNGLTLLELSALLTNAAFRQLCLQQTKNADVKAYFESRYNRASDNFQAVLRDPVLNKISAFTSDPRLRHLIGQRQSTFSLVESLDERKWILLLLDKGALGEETATFGSLFFTKLKNATFMRRERELVTFYVDEVQNYVSSDSALETLLSEARKFGISVVTANQFLDQYPASTKAAMLAAGTHIFFRVSSSDADKIAHALDGGRALSELLKHLPQRNFVATIGHHRWQRGVVGNFVESSEDYEDLYNRCRARWGRERSAIEAEIQQRHALINRSSSEVLDAWE